MSAIRRRSWGPGCIRFGLQLLPRALRHLLIRGCWLCRRSRPCDCGRSGSGSCRRLGRGVSESLGCRRGCGSQIRVSTRGVRSLERRRRPGTASPLRRRCRGSSGRWVTATRSLALSGARRTRTRSARSSSPDCGHTYTRQGTYTVRATSYWLVTWAGIGQSGTIPLDFTRTAVITMGEAQVLIR